MNGTSRSINKKYKRRKGKYTGWHGAKVGVEVILYLPTMTGSRSRRSVNAINIWDRRSRLGKSMNGLSLAVAQEPGQTFARQS